MRADGKVSHRTLRHNWRECEVCGELALIKRGNKPSCRVCGLGKLKEDLTPEERKAGRMKLPKKQAEPAQETRITVRNDLVDKLIAVRCLEAGEGTTKYSDGQIVPWVDCQFHRITKEGKAAYVGRTRIYQTLLVEAFREADDDWIVGRIKLGERAYLFNRPEDSEIASCEKAVAELG